MPKKLLIILLLLLSNFLFAQEWSDPVLISTMQGYNDNPDFTIDKNGVIHCVWSHEIEDGFMKIYYSKSEDDGKTWSTSVDVSFNNEKKCRQPHIAIDSEDNIYVTYDYNTANYYETQVHLRKYNGVSWSDSIVISEGYPGADNSRITIDNNNRVYVFWELLKIYYRYLENDILSDIICPYDDNDWYFLEKAITDKENNLHCVGSYLKEGQSADSDNTIYLKFDYLNGIWSNIEILSTNNIWIGKDIDLDKNDYPRIVWHEQTNPYPNINDATLYAYFNGNTWSEPELIVEDPFYQVIAIDSLNNTHLANSEKTETGKQLVHYTKHQDNWEGIIIDTAGAALAQGKLICYDHCLYIIYAKGEVAFGNLNITFSKFNVPTTIPENVIKNYSTESLKQNYPNPFYNQTQINFTLNQGGVTSLKIFNLKGQLVKILISENKIKGDYSIIWNGTDQKGNKVTTGIYLYRLQVDKYCMTRSLIITN